MFYGSFLEKACSTPLNTSEGTMQHAGKLSTENEDRGDRLELGRCEGC